MKQYKKYKKFNTETEAIEWLNNYYSTSEIEKFNYKNNRAVYMYKGEYYKIINQNINNSINNEYKEIANEIQIALTNNIIKDNIIVTRYLSLSEMYLLHKKTKHKKIYSYYKFVSCTMLPKIFNMTSINKRNKIVIYITKGTKGAFIPNVMGNKEYEILLPCNTQIKRIGINKYITCIE